MLTKQQLQSLNLLRHPTLAGNADGYSISGAVQVAMAEIEALQATIRNLTEQNLQAAMEAAEWKCRAMAAEATVDRLPKTADGVPITLGMTVYLLGFDGIVREKRVWSITARLIGIRNGMLRASQGMAELERLFSTREAAEVAQAAEDRE